MVAPNYPSSPTLGQQFVVGNVTFQWDGEKWKALSSADNTTRIVKAFARFTGTGGISNTNYYGIASVTRDGVGLYTITTEKEHPNAVVSIEVENGGIQAFMLANVLQPTPTTFSITVGSDFAVLADGRQVNFAILG